jgi:predicted nucleic-acid-binding protein
MIGLDTNVLLRAVTQDDPVQTPIARAMIGKLDEGSPGYISTVVLAEFSWSLRTRFKYERLAIIGAIEALLESAAFVVSDRDAVNAAVSRSREDGLDFADALIGEMNYLAGCRTTMTFDRLAAKQSRITYAEGAR